MDGTTKYGTVSACVALTLGAGAMACVILWVLVRLAGRLGVL